MSKYLTIHVDTTGIDFNTYDISEGYEIVAITLMSCDDDFKILKHVTLYNSSVSEEGLRDSTMYHSIDRGVLDDVGMDEEQFVEAIAAFIFEEFLESESQHLPKIKCLGHNIGTFALPFLKKYLQKYDLPIEFSCNVLDTHSVLIPTVGDMSLQDMIAIFGDDRNDDEYSTTLYKCKLFVNIFKKVKRLWIKKVLS